MADFDLQVRNSRGVMVPASELISTMRYVNKITTTAASGSAAVPSGWTASTGIYIVSQEETGANAYSIQVSISGSTVTWSGNPSGKQLNILFFLNKQTSPPTGWGLWVKNGNGYVTLDTTYKPMAIHSRGTVSLTKVTTDWYRSAGITIPPGCMLFANTIVGDRIGMIGHYYSDVLYILSSTRSSVPWILAEVSPTVPDSAYGLQLFDSSGARIFDQAQEILDVVQAATINIGQARAGFTVPASANYVHVASPGLGLFPDRTAKPGFARKTATSALMEYSFNSSLPPGGAGSIPVPDSVSYSYLLLEA